MKIASLLFALCVGPFVKAVAGEGAQTTHPNVVLIYSDDVGFGDVGCYGATRVRTPQIDRLAREGLKFTDAHSSSATCTPSRYALLTGEYPWRRKGTGVLPGDARLIIDPGSLTFPGMLQKAGYKTGVVGKWHLGLGLQGGPDWNGEIKPGPLEIGFDYAYILPATGDRVPCVYVENRRVVGLDPADPIHVSYSQPIGSDPTGKLQPELLKVKPSHGHDMTIVNGISRIGYMAGGKSARWVDEDMADILTRQATAFIEKNKNAPFFLYFATHDIHVPRVPHARFAGKSKCGTRGDVIEELDWSVGQILKALDDRGLSQKTIVIFSSDNGPVVDDGYKDGAARDLSDHKPAGPYRGGKYSAFEGGTRVPMILRWPGQVEPGISTALICHIDYFASIAALLGQPLPPKSAPDSMNLLRSLLGREKTGRTTLVEQAGVLALRQGAWKLIEPGNGPGKQIATNTETGQEKSVQLYNLALDPGEQENLASAQPARVGEMRLLLNSIRTGAERE